MAGWVPQPTKTAQQLKWKSKFTAPVLLIINICWSWSLTGLFMISRTDTICFFFSVMPWNCCMAQFSDSSLSYQFNVHQESYLGCFVAEIHIRDSLHVLGGAQLPSIFLLDSSANSQLVVACPATGPRRCCATAAWRTKRS